MRFDLAKKSTLKFWRPSDSFPMLFKKYKTLNMAVENLGCPVLGCPLLPTSAAELALFQAHSSLSVSPLRQAPAISGCCSGSSLCLECTCLPSPPSSLPLFPQFSLSLALFLGKVFLTKFSPHRLSKQPFIFLIAITLVSNSICVIS